MTIRIVFVDDELDILQAMRRTFRGMKDEWSMEFVSSGAAALDAFSKGSSSKMSRARKSRPGLPSSI